MKILLYSSAGFSENVLPLYKALLNRGEDVTYLFMSSNLSSTIFNVKKTSNRDGVINISSYPELDFLKEYVDTNSIYVANNAFRLKTPIKSFIAIIKTIVFVMRGEYDVILTDNVYMYWNVFMYIFRNKTVLLLHDPFEHTGMEWSRDTRRRIHRAFRLLNKFVVLNKTQYHDFCKINKIEEKNVLCNKLGALSPFNLFKQKNVKEIKHHILFFGGIARYKGIEYLCEAMKKVHDVIPDATVTIAGSKPFYFDISEYSALPYFDIQNRFVGPEELASMIQESTICVQPYTDATQSGCVLLSYTLGKPIITSDLDTMRELVDEGKSGLLVEPRNADKLADAIIKLLSDDALRLEMKNYIQNEYFTKERSWDYIADKYIEFFKQDA